MHSDLPLSGLSHVPSDITHLFLLRQELIQVQNALPVLIEQLALPGYRFTGFDQVENEDWSTIPAEEIIEVFRCRGIKRIFDGDCES